MQQDLPRRPEPQEARRGSPPQAEEGVSAVRRHRHHTGRPHEFCARR